MSVPLKTFGKNPHIYAPLIATASLFIVTFFIGYTNFLHIKEKLILHKDVQGTIDLTGTRKELFFALGAICAVALINEWIAKAAYGRERLFSYLFSYTNVWIAFLSLILILSVSGMN